MLHVNNQKVRKLLFTGKFGLEKESLRVLRDGSFSHTPHPFPDDEHIVRDFCENQTEINTSVFPTAEGASEDLLKHTARIQEKISVMPEPELLWPFSNPSFIKNEEDIPVARFEGGRASKTDYREYLSGRYGRYKMTLCGIHVNYSFSDELLEADFEESGESDFRRYRDSLYLDVAEKAAVLGWVITALTAASPVSDGSFVEKGVRGRTSFVGMSSIRCSELGYWNFFAPVFDYTDINTYAASIQRYVDEKILKAPTELYYPVRLKPAGRNILSKLCENGADHIEFRMVDLNPLELSGINILDLKFIQLFLVWLAGTPARRTDENEQILAVQNFKNAAHYDLKTVRIITPSGSSFTADRAGLDIIDSMREFYKGFPDEVREVLDFEAVKFIDPDRRYSWIIRKKYGDDFLEKGLELAEKQQKEITGGEKCANSSGHH